MYDVFFILQMFLYIFYVKENLEYMYDIVYQLNIGFDVVIINR